MSADAGRRAPRGRFWVELVLAAVAGLLAVLTLITREWIEIVSGWDPDHGNGAVEWLIVLVCAVLAVVAGVAARVEWRRAAGPVSEQG
jgi:hypothetical protein